MKLRKILALGIVVLMITAMFMVPTAMASDDLNILSLPNSAWSNNRVTADAGGGGAAGSIAITGGGGAAVTVTQSADGGWGSGIIVFPTPVEDALRLELNLTVNVGTTLQLHTANEEGAHVGTLGEPIQNGTQTINLDLAGTLYGIWFQLNGGAGSVVINSATVVSGALPPVTPSGYSQFNFVTAPAANWSSTSNGGGSIAVTAANNTLVFTNEYAVTNSAFLNIREQGIFITPAQRAGLNLYVDIVVANAEDAEARVKLHLSNAIGGAMAAPTNIDITGLIATATDGWLHAGTHTLVIPMADVLDGIDGNFHLAGAWVEMAHGEGTATISNFRVGGQGGPVVTTAPPATTTAPPTGTATATPTAPGSTNNPQTFDPGVAMVFLTGLAGMGGAALALKKKK